MMNHIKIIDHISDRCPDGEKKYQKFEPASNSPEIWIEKSFNMLNESFEGININGYTVNFSKRSIINVILKKQFAGFQNQENIEDLLNITLKSYVYQKKSELEKYVEFSKILEIPFYFIATPYLYPHSEMNFNTNQKLIFIYDMSDLNNIKLKYKFNVMELENWLTSIKEYEFKENKPLNYADMYLSCYVSKFTKNQLPGDLDYCVFYNNGVSKSIAFVFEFKTHNLDTPIYKENMNNYKEKDFRRFMVFNFLLKQIQHKQKYSPIFVYLAWGTNIKLHNHRNIKLDFMYYKNNSLHHFYNEEIENPEILNSYQELKNVLDSAIQVYKKINKKGTV